MSIYESKQLKKSVIGLVDSCGKKKKVWRYRGGRTLDFPYDEFTSLASFEEYIKARTPKGQ